MTVYRDSFPPSSADLFLAYVGMETDLIFNQGVDLPGFASYPLLKTTEGRELLKGYLRNLIALGKETGAGVILESPTWVANRDRGKALGYGISELKKLNQEAIAMMAAVRLELSCSYCNQCEYWTARRCLCPCSANDSK